MTRIDNIFQRARQIKPPLTFEEATQVIQQAVPVKDRRKTNSKKRLFLFWLTLFITAVLLAIAWPKSKKYFPEDITILPEKQPPPSKETIIDKKQTLPPQQYENPEITNQAEGSLVHNTYSTPAENQSANTAKISHATETESHQFNFRVNKQLQDTMTQAHIPFAPDELLNDSIREELISKIDSTEKEPAKQAQTDSLKKVDEIIFIKDTTSKKSRRFRSNFVKVDIVGLFNPSLNPTYTNWDVYQSYFKQYRGNRITIGYERILTSRIGLEINGSYGFPRFEYSGGGGVSPSTTYFQYINYKGWLVNLGLRYYVWKGKYPGSGLYLGPYGGIAHLQERILYYSEVNGMKNVTTLSASTGNTRAFGVFGGYKFIYKNWFAETNIGYAIEGDDHFFNDAIDGLGGFARWPIFDRIEFSLGYLF